MKNWILSLAIFFSFNPLMAQEDNISKALTSYKFILSTSFGVGSLDFIDFKHLEQERLNLGAGSFSSRFVNFSLKYKFSPHWYLTSGLMVNSVSSRLFLNQIDYTLRGNRLGVPLTIKRDFALGENILSSLFLGGYYNFADYTLVSHSTDSQQDLSRPGAGIVLGMNYDIKIHERISLNIIFQALFDFPSGDMPQLGGYNLGVGYTAYLF